MSSLTLGQKRLAQHFNAVADAIARVDIDQEDRERVAESVADAVQADEKLAASFKRDVFVVLASDPLVPCAGPRDGGGCPHGRTIRIAMHQRRAPDGRSANWRQRAPFGAIRCVSCGGP